METPTIFLLLETPISTLPPRELEKETSASITALLKNCLNYKVSLSRLVMLC